MRRKEFILMTLGLSATLSTSFKNKPPVILIVNGWQPYNIGDIGHVPGILKYFEVEFPDARILLWPKKLSGYGVEKMLNNRFPKLALLKEGYTPEVYDSNLKSISQADILIHGSGSGLVAPDPINWWIRDIGKPFGFFGITVTSMYDQARTIFNKAGFIFVREEISVKILRENGFADKALFVPDSTFNFDLTNTPAASGFIKSNDLKTKKFICVVPRLRFTPYHKFTNVEWTSERIKKVEETNAQFAEKDHKKLRDVITQWVNETGNKVVICPEMEYQVGIMKDLLLDKLDDSIRSNVATHSYWLPDEAASLYEEAFAVVSMECHSPILAITADTLAFYLRQPEDTHKGEMYNNLSLGDWEFMIDDVDGAMIAEELLRYYEHPSKVYAKIKTTKQIVQKQNDLGKKIVDGYLR